MSSGRRILLIEDDPAITQFLTMALEDEGYIVATAMDGAAGLDAVVDQTPALILLDMRMPILDGQGFAAAYREHAPPHAPIIVLTASRDVAAAAEAVRADDALAKPFDLYELLAVIERHLDP